VGGALGALALILALAPTLPSARGGRV
jgi:hypothetical protein